MFQKTKTLSKEQENTDETNCYSNEIDKPEKNEVLIPFIIRNHTTTSEVLIDQIKQALTSTNMGETSPHKDAATHTENKPSVLFKAYLTNEDSKD